MDRESPDTCFPPLHLTEENKADLRDLLRRAFPELEQQLKDEAERELERQAKISALSPVNLLPANYASISAHNKLPA